MPKFFVNKKQVENETINIIGGDINHIKNVLRKKEKEKIEIKSLRRGECLTFVGDEHILIKINASDFEKKIIEEKNN